jgi:hypothetical protein
MGHLYLFEGVLSYRPAFRGPRYYRVDHGTDFCLGSPRDPVVVDEGYPDTVTFHSIDVEYSSELAKHVGQRVKLRACVDERYEQHSLDDGYSYPVKVRCLTGVRLITRDTAKVLEKNGGKPAETESAEFLDWWKRNIDDAA